MSEKEESIDLIRVKAIQAELDSALIEKGRREKKAEIVKWLRERAYMYAAGKINKEF